MLISLFKTFLLPFNFINFTFFLFYFPDTVQLLLSRDAPIKSRNAAGWTPLDEAISYGDRAMSECLKEDQFKKFFNLS